jgi:peptidoglycan/xylan/chitin deacetylase (PgdA/CDA1 family)
VNPWQPSALLKLSLAAHAAAAGVVMVNPALWPWAVGGVLADHAVLTASGLWPRSALLGPNWTRLPPPAQRRREIAITLDDGPDPEVTPRVLDILDRHAAVATFFCIGRRVAEHPALAREIVRRGHSIENHSQDHRHDFSLRGPRRMRAEISAAQEVIGAVVGTRPGFFRAPAGLRNPFLDPVLAGLGLELASWTRRGFDTVTRRPASVLARLAKGLQAGDILLLHDGHAARSDAGAAVILEVLPPLCAAIRGRGLIPVTLRAAREVGGVAPVGPAPGPVP